MNTSAPVDENRHAWSQSRYFVGRTRTHFESLDVVAARLPCGSPGGVLALGAHVVDREGDRPAAERRHAAGDLRADPDLRQLVLAEIEHDPYVVQVDEGHDGKAGRRELPLMQNDLVDLGRDRRAEGDIGGEGARLLDRRAGTPADLGRRGAFLLAEAVEGQVVLRARGVCGVERRAIRGIDLVVALLRDQPFLVERIDAFVGRRRQIRRRHRTLPVRLGGAHVFLAHPAVQQPLLRHRGPTRGFGLRNLGLHLRAVERDQQRAGYDLVALTHVEARDAPENLRRDVDVTAVDLALQRRDDRFVGQIETVDDEYDGADRDECAGQTLDQSSVIFSHGRRRTVACWTYWERARA